MPKNVHINTPLPIRVGNDEYKLITYEDLYRRCLNKPAIFDEMAENPGNLGTILQRLKLVLPEECFEQLLKLLNNPAYCRLAKEYLKNRTPWPSRKIAFWGDTRSKEFSGPCTWPNCPSE